MPSKVNATKADFKYLHVSKPIPAPAKNLIKAAQAGWIRNARKSREGKVGQQTKVARCIGVGD